MSEKDQNNQSDFLIEKIKQRPINRRKLIRRTIITAAMAVIFGLIACFTFLVLEPIFSKWLNPEEEPQVIVLPEDQEEMLPEEMLAENQPTESPSPEPSEEGVVLEPEQIEETKKLPELMTSKTPNSPVTCPNTSRFNASIAFPSRPLSSM